VKRRETEPIGATSPVPVVDLQEYRERKRRQRVERALKGDPNDTRDLEAGADRVGSGVPVELFRGYQPHAKQVDLHECGTRYVVVVAGRRSGKTYGVAREFMARIYEDYARWRQQGGTWRRPAKLGPETSAALEYWAVAPTYWHVSYQQQEIFEVLGGGAEESPLVLKYDRNRSTLWLKGGIKIQFRSAEHPESLVGSGLSGVWVDEAARVKKRAWTDNLRGALSDNLGWGLFSTTPMGQNWVYSDLWQRTQLGTREEDRSPHWHAVHFTTADNTALPHLQKEVQQARAELPYHLFARNYLASFSAFEGKVFEAFRDNDTHVVERVPFGSFVRKVAGVDWGHNNPGVQLEAGVTDEGEVYVYREDYRRKLNVAPPSGRPDGPSWVRKFRGAQARGVDRWWADPSGAGHISTCRREGLAFRQADNSVAEGIDAVAAMLEPVEPPGGGTPRPALFIHRNCRNLRRELLSYQYQDGSEDPVKKDDHAVDALRYLIYSEHRRPDGDGFARLDFSVWSPERQQEAA